MEHGGCVFRMDTGCEIFIKILNIKALSSFLKYCKSVSETVSFFVSQSKIIIKAIGGESIAESIIYTENLLEFNVEMSDMMLRSSTDTNDIFIMILFQVSELSKSIGKTSKGKHIIISKQSNENTISIYMNDSNTINRIGHSRSNSDMTIYDPTLDESNYTRIVTFSMAEFILFIQGLNKFYSSDNLIEFGYGHDGISIRVFTGESESIITFGKTDNDISEYKLFKLIDILSMKNLNGIINEGVIKCYISNNYNYMLFVLALSDIGVCNIRFTPQETIGDNI